MSVDGGLSQHQESITNTLAVGDEYQDFKISRFQDFKISRFQD